jgi:hypothetical protein
MPTTIGALLSAIGIAGMDRLVRFNVLAMSGRAVEAAGDVARPPSSSRCAAYRAGAGRCRAARLARRRDLRGPLHRRARQGEVRHSRPRSRRVARPLHSLHRAEPHERRRGRRTSPRRSARWLVAVKRQLQTGSIPWPVMWSLPAPPKSQSYRLRHRGNPGRRCQTEGRFRRSH